MPRHCSAASTCSTHAAVVIATGPQGAGRVLIDDLRLGRIVPPNLTRSLRNPAYTDDALRRRDPPRHPSRGHAAADHAVG
jgi:hypothetical protein